MEPVFAVECMRHVPNPFALVHVAARRARSLHCGAEPRISTNVPSRAELALREIAAGAFSDEELIALFSGRSQAPAAETVDHIDEAAFIGNGGAAAVEPLVFEGDLN